MVVGKRIEPASLSDSPGTTSVVYTCVYSSSYIAQLCIVTMFIWYPRVCMIYTCTCMYVYEAVHAYIHVHYNYVSCTCTLCMF